MKLKKINPLRFGIFCIGVFFMLVNCQLDDEFHQLEQNNTENTEPPFTVTRISKKEINQNQLISGVLERIKRQTITPVNGNLNRLITNATFNVVIDDENAKYLEKSDGSYHSYTFKVVDDDEASKKNLVLSVKEDGTYKEILVSYYLTEDDLQTYQLTGIIDFDTKITYNVINEDTFSIDIYSREVAPDTDSDCISMVYNGTNCTGTGRHSWANRLDCQVWIACQNASCPEGYNPPTPGTLTINVNQFCIDAGGNNNDADPGPHDNGNDGSGGNGGTGEDNDDYDPTDPDVHGNGAEGDDDPLFPPELDEDNFDPQHEENCLELKKIGTEPTLFDEFQQLNDNLGFTYETGYGLVATEFSPFFNSQFLQANVNAGRLEISVPRSNVLFSFLHVHPVGGSAHPMFGPGDLNSLYTFSQNFNPTFNYEYNNSIFTVYMTINNYVYALKIKDINVLSEISNIYSNKKLKNRFVRNLEDAYDDINNDSATASSDAMAEVFLEHLKDYKLYDGISLYRSTYDTSEPINERLNDWEKLYLTNSNNIDKEPCN